jgi:ADP-ribose pyrophosphatase
VSGAPAPHELRDEAVAETVLDSRRQFTGAVFALDSEQVSLPDGVVVRDVVRHPGAVGVMALDESGRVLLVRQYRHAVGAVLWEPPAGLLDVPGEDPLAAARRELLEETHHTADAWSVLVDAFTTPGMSGEAVRLYRATGVRPASGPRHLGSGEEREMEHRWWPLDDIVDAVLDGRLHNPLVVMGALALVAADGRGRAPDASWFGRPNPA